MRKERSECQMTNEKRSKSKERKKERKKKIREKQTFSLS